MLNGKKIVVVLPAYNAEKTLTDTYREIPFPLVDEVVLVDDFSSDATVALANQLGIHHVIVHDRNIGYGGNQKTCYRKALELKADIIIMLHPDYQYTPRLIPAMAWLIAEGLYDVVLGSRILGGGALKGGMPLYKYVANRVLTLFQNWMLGQKLSEYHTGYRAFSRRSLETIPFERNSDDFVFDNQVLSQLFMAGFQIAELTCPTRYFPQASSINFMRSLKYGLGVLLVSFQHRFHRMGLLRLERYALRRPAD